MKVQFYWFHRSTWCGSFLVKAISFLRKNKRSWFLFLHSMDCLYERGFGSVLSLLESGHSLCVGEYLYSSFSFISWQTITYFGLMVQPLSSNFGTLLLHSGESKSALSHSGMGKSSFSLKQLPYFQFWSGCMLPATLLASSTGLFAVCFSIIHGSPLSHYARNLYNFFSLASLFHDR